MFKTAATLPSQRSGSFGNETLRPSLRRSALPPKGDCSADYSQESYITVIRRTDDINNIESEGRYRFAVAVMPRRTDAINSIESEGRYDGKTPDCGRAYHCGRIGGQTYDNLLQEDIASALCPLVVFRPSHFPNRPDNLT